MKIQDLSSLGGMIHTAAGVGKREARTGAVSFQQEMSQLDRANWEQRLNELHQNITTQSRLVSSRCDMLELKRYKEMIAEFMFDAVRFAYEFKKQSTMDPRGRRRLFALIKRINLKLEELTAQMLSGQADNLAVMAAVDELRGLLLDLYL